LPSESNKQLFGLELFKISPFNLFQIQSEVEEDFDAREHHTLINHLQCEIKSMESEHAKVKTQQDSKTKELEICH
jgi:hypothetical protein